VKRGVRMAGIALAATAAGATAFAAGPRPPEILALLHDGRFDAARDALRKDGPPTGPENLFLDAFTTYWRLVFDDENDAVRSTLEGQLQATVDAAEAAHGQGDAALWGGSAHLLLAELRASQRRALAAAFEAKKAKRLLESETLQGSAATDALFGLGTFNYVAGTVPSYVKGLRALLFLPRGDRDLGLRQLEETAAKSRYFALEARTLLVTIYANKRERLYAQALDERDRLVTAAPEAIAGAYASARLELSLGRNDLAMAQLARAEARARELGDVDPVVLRCIDILRARAELASFRPDRAQATTERALASGAGLSPGLKRDLDEMRLVATNLARGVAWPQDAAEDGPRDEEARFAALAAKRPEIPVFALVAGDAGLRAGRAQEALDWLTRAASTGLPIEWQAGCQFRQGQAEDLLGRRSRALEIYKKVSATSGFVARDGAYYLQQSPYGTAR